MLLEDPKWENRFVAYAQNLKNNLICLDALSIYVHIFWLCTLAPDSSSFASNFHMAMGAWTNVRWNQCTACDIQRNGLQTVLQGLNPSCHNHSRLATVQNRHAWCFKFKGLRLMPPSPKFKKSNKIKLHFPIHPPSQKFKDLLNMSNFKTIIQCIQCMYSVYVFNVCILCIYSMYVFCVYILCMYFMYSMYVF